jgi:phosphatidylserine decarboxylase
MRIPITKYGLPQAVLYPALLAAVMAAYAVIFWLIIKPHCSSATTASVIFWLPQAVLFVVLIWVVSFFRDPSRRIPDDPAALLSPADGTIAAVEQMDSCTGFDGPVLRIEIFLSIFNVHINRTPSRVRIGQIRYKPGRFLDARNPRCSKVNEANEIEMFRLDEPKDRLMVRQISGAIARRIVCEAKPNDTFEAGQPFGMIKFGSCTELYVPLRPSLSCRVQKGDKVKAGLTLLGRYENAAENR